MMCALRTAIGGPASWNALCVLQSQVLAQLAQVS
jgi:hypothetical protein